MTARCDCPPWRTWPLWMYWHGWRLHREARRKRIGQAALKVARERGLL